jgi:NADH-quinone oxidoreductase subunit N
MMGLYDSLQLAAPELTLAIGAMVMLLLGVFTSDRMLRPLSWLMLGICALAAALVFQGQWAPRATAFHNLYVADQFGAFLKIVILAGSAACALLAPSFLEEQKIGRFEYPVILLLATLGMMLMVSANDLITLYIGLELQSLALYVLAAFNRDSAKSTEAGLKYFVLGALSSGLLLYGCSLVYGFTGTTNFDGLHGALGATAADGAAGVGLLFGLLFILAGLAFKVSAVPFHMWTPDVYEGSPTPVTAFFAAAPKVAAMGLLLRVMLDAFPGLVDQWHQVIVFISVASMMLGAVAAIVQTNIKRLLAYSSIGHVGYALVGLAAGSEEGVRGVLVYMTIYLAMTLGAFACVMAMKRGSEQVETIDDLAGLSVRQPGLALALATLMFSLAGIPLLAGFFGKLYIFVAAINAGLFTLAILGVIASVIGAYYYLRIVKIMYFDEPAAAFTPVGSRAHGVILAASALAASPLSFIYIAPLLATAGIAARSLLS